jgi:hypothetical protein
MLVSLQDVAENLSSITWSDYHGQRTKNSKECKKTTGNDTKRKESREKNQKRHQIKA